MKLRIEPARFKIGDTVIVNSPSSYLHGKEATIIGVSYILKSDERKPSITAIRAEHLYLKEGQNNG